MRSVAADNDQRRRDGPIVKSIEISRRPQDVFAYLTDFSHFPEWQGGVVSARRDGNAPLTVGSRAMVTRRVGPREEARTEEITELRPPRAWAVRGVGGVRSWPLPGARSSRSIGQSVARDDLPRV